MKKSVVALIIIGLLLSGCVSNKSDTVDNNETNNDQNDGGESDIVEKIGENNNVKTIVISNLNNDVGRRLER